MSINTEINLLKNTKEELCVAIMEKGVIVSPNDLFSTYPTRISQIPITSGDKDNLFRTLIEKTETELIIPEGTTTIENSRFINVITLTSVTIPSSVNKIEQYAFNGCTSLQSITCLAIIPPILSRVGLGTGYILPFDNTNNCPIYVPEESVNAYKTAWTKYADRIQAIQANTFAVRFTPTGGGTPIEVELEDLTTEGVLTRGDIPSSILNGTGSLEIGDGVTQIADAQNSNNGVFYNCLGITSFRISNTVTTIGNWAFNTCLGIENVVIPNSVEYIGDYVFQNCGRLVNATLPDGITRIGKNLFRNCAQLEYIDIPSSVTNIGLRAFYGCTSLLYITVNATTPPALDNANVFSNTNSCPIYVPAESVETYKSTSDWNTYASRIEAIPS